MSSPIIWNASAVVLLKLKLPVSVLTAVYRHRAISVSMVTPSCLISSHTTRPVALDEGETRFRWA